MICNIPVLFEKLNSHANSMHTSHFVREKPLLSLLRFCVYQSENLSTSTYYCLHRNTCSTYIQKHTFQEHYMKYIFFMGVRLRSTEPVPIPMVTVVMPGVVMTLRCWSIMPTSVVVPASCWCAWSWDFVRAICCDMPIIITVKPSDVRAIACHLTSFLALEAFIIITGHGIDRWWW